MSTDKGAVLLRLARQAIECALGLGQPVRETAPWLSESGATFVTLHSHGHLRGCIGSLEAHRALVQDVASNAVAAALRDPRFLPLTPEELPDLEVEVSLLSPLEPIRFSDEADAARQLRPGVDGVVLEYQGRRGTFLPQVWEDLPEPKRFLAQLKRKAGLPEGFWAPALRLYRYTVAKWKESDVPKEMAA